MLMNMPMNVSFILRIRSSSDDFSHDILTVIMMIAGVINFFVLYFNGHLIASMNIFNHYISERKTLRIIIK